MAIVPLRKKKLAMPAPPRYALPLPNPDELTSHLTKLHKTQQVIGYPPEGEGANESLLELNRAMLTQIL